MLDRITGARLILNPLHFFNRFKHRRLEMRVLAGFTLIELIVTLSILAVVIFVSWSGVFATLNMSAIAEARSARRLELNQAVDFLSDEIRTATRINQSERKQIGTHSLEEVVVDAGIPLEDLGDIGTIALYLEHQLTLVPGESPICPPDSINPGRPKVLVDRIVYDIRQSPDGWLSPRTIARYGRIPIGNGTFDPCADPISGDIIIDSLSDSVSPSPSCDLSLLAGLGGFYTCTSSSGQSVDLFLQSNIRSDEIKPLHTAVTSRQMPGSSILKGVNDIWFLRLDNSKARTVTLSWDPKSTSAYTVLRSDRVGSTLEIDVGVQTSYVDTAVDSGSYFCYQVKTNGPVENLTEEQCITVQ